MCSPDCVVAPQGHEGSSQARILCSHSLCGPFPVRIHVYADRARLRHPTNLPLPYVATDLASALIALLACRMPPSYPSVVIPLSPAIWPRCDSKVARWSAISLPVIPM